MTRVLSIMALALAVAAAGVSGERGQGTAIPNRVIPIEDFAVFPNNWADESAPRYAIIGNIQEWKSVFSPAATMGSNKPFQPDPALFENNVLIAVMRVSDAPAPGEKVLAINSFVQVGGEAVLTYTFTPPARKATSRVKNVLLIMIPAQYQDVIRFIEDEESPASLAAKAELEAAKAAGLYKQPAPGQAPMQMPAQPPAPGQRQPQPQQQARQVPPPPAQAPAQRR